MPPLIMAIISEEMSCDVLYLIIERFFLIVGDGDLDNGWNPGGCIVDLF